MEEGLISFSLFCFCISSGWIGRGVDGDNDDEKTSGGDDFIFKSLAFDVFYEVNEHMPNEMTK